MIEIDVQFDGENIEQIREAIIHGIQSEIGSRGARVSNELTNAVAFVMRGARGGRRYRIPGTKKSYQASAPGEPPAVRTGVYRASFQPRTEIEGGGDGVVVHSITESTHTVNGYVLYELLEGGTGKMAPRPHAQKIMERATPRAVRIYSEPYGR